MALIEGQNISEGGIISSRTAAAASATFENSGSEFMLVVNDSEESTLVTVVAEITTFDVARYGDVEKVETALTVDAGDVAFLGPFPPASYNDEDGIATVTMTHLEDVSVAILTVGNN